ncbi:MAG TPA: hypothetical protein PLE30_04275 [Candidatus Kapabacteria bacterium]|nr:hypothetical protein [Candidatus Kapabacteria bacterium]
MKITEISSQNYQAFQPKELKKSDISNNSIKSTDKLEINQSSNNWQKDILLDALSMIENNIQLDNNMPLDKVQNQPIETYEEALMELNWLKTPFFKAQAYNAQANLEAGDVMYLFTEN